MNAKTVKEKWAHCVKWLSALNLPHSGDITISGVYIRQYEKRQGVSHRFWMFPNRLQIVEKAEGITPMDVHMIYLMIVGLESDVAINAQAKEIERLRAALEKIASSTYSHAPYARQEAENALKPQESEVQHG